MRVDMERAMWSGSRRNCLRFTVHATQLLGADAVRYS